MNRKGNCYDSAMAESFFRTLKVKLVYQTHFDNITEAKYAIIGYVEGYYNRKRKHPSLGYKTPTEFEEIALNNSP